MDDRFEDWLRETARDYNQPPETPREEMWARVKAERPEKPFRLLRSLRHLRPLALAAGVAALLALGIGLGRWTVRTPNPPSAPTSVAALPAERGSAAYQLATTEHLGQAEAFLTLFRASIRGQGNERLASATARQLLATNRLLLDSPAAKDARMRLLLQDLELVLAEIAQLSPQPRAADLDLIAEGLEEGGMLSRLRTVVPAGASASQGAL